ncbi:MAG: hypothetical protein QM758_16805 [Armatimonas sp.]
MRLFLTLLCLLGLCGITLAQKPVEDPRTPEIIAKHGFREYQIKSGSDWVTFYVHAPGRPPWRNLVLFLSGSTPDPSFSYELKDGKLVSYFWGHKDYEQLPPDYAFAVIAKRGREGAINENAPDGETGPPDVYLKKNSLDYRVWQADQTINYCRKNLLSASPKIIVYGHSEGAPVAAKLGTVNRSITHLGFWCGNALPDYYEFILMQRKEFYSGKITDAEAQQKIDTLLEDYKTIFAAPKDTHPHNDSHMYTKKRWSSYAEPPLNHLLRIRIPIFLQVATLDDNAPIETTYIVPLEFTRLGKRNLTYRVGVGWDHSLNSVDAAGKKTSHWNTVFQEFFQWTQTKATSK